MKLSVVIPTSGPQYHERLRNCLRSVKAQVYCGQFETIITYLYRKGKMDPTWLSDLENECTIIRHEYDAVDWVPALSRNIGFRAASGEVLMSVDADSFLHPQTFQLCSDAVDQGQFVTVLTRMLFYPPSSPIFNECDPSLWERVQQEGKWGQGPGCAIAAKRQHVYSVRGWDERFTGYGAADHDFVIRLEKLGVPHFQLPTRRHNVYVIHQYHPPLRVSVNKVLRRQNVAYYERSKKRKNPVRNNRDWGAGTK